MQRENAPFGYLAKMDNHSIIVHYGEIGLKGKNQRDFRERLRENIRLKLARAGLRWPVRESRGLLVVRVPPEAEGDIEGAMGELASTFGVAWLARSVNVLRENAAPPRSEATMPRPASREAHFELVRQRLLESARANHAPGKKFVVRVNRADKSWPFSSIALERDLGALLIRETPWKKVSLNEADITFNLDFRENATFIFSERVAGPGGLPVGSSGKVLVLLSGGIDSPVAAYLMAKRGCRVDFIHFTTGNTTEEEARTHKATQLAERLSVFTLQSRLFLVPYVHFDLALMREKVDYELVLFRRFMARVAQRLTRSLKAQALASGDNLSQVASQTLSNLVSTSQAVDLPIFRPLIGFDKQEIIELARKIGTYDLSLQPYKDCCAIIAQHPRTRSRDDRLAAMEARLFPDYDKLIERTLADAVHLQVTLASETLKAIEPREVSG